MRGKVKKEKEILMLLETKNKTKNKTKKHNECKKINQRNKFLIKYMQYITHYIASKSIVFLIKMSINK